MRLNFIFWFLALTEANIIREEGKKLTENLMDFPFRLLDGSHQQQDNSLASRLEGGGVEVVGDEEIDDTVEGVVEVAQQEKRVMIMKLRLWRSSVTNL